MEHQNHIQKDHESNPNRRLGLKTFIALSLLATAITGAGNAVHAADESPASHAGALPALDAPSLLAQGAPNLQSPTAPEPDGALYINIPNANQGDQTFLNLTPLLSPGLGYVSMFGGDSEGWTGTSAANFSQNSVLPNVATAPVGANGSVLVKNSEHGSIKLVADHQVTIDGDSYMPANGRLLDTRTNGDIMSPNEIVCLPVAGNAGDGEALNITVVGADTPGYMVAYNANAASLPEASVINYKPGETAVNLTVVEVGGNPNQEVCIKNGGSASAHLIVDDYGAILNKDFNPTSTGVPDRVIDTRIAQNHIGPNGMIGFAYGTPGDVIAVNITVTDAHGPGNGKLISSDDLNKNYVHSNVNFNVDNNGVSTVLPNMAFARIGQDGMVYYMGSEHSTHDVIIDVLGTINGAVVTDASNVRLVDQRETNDRLEPSPKMHRPGLTEVAYDPNAVMPANANIEVVKVRSNISYGPSSSQFFDVYESANRPDRARANNKTIVTFFGGGYESGNNQLTSSYDKLAKHLAAEYGFTLISVNYRWSTEAPSPAQYQDAVAAMKVIEFLAADLDIDPDQITAMGFSAGGDIGAKLGYAFDAPEYQPTWLSAEQQKLSARPKNVINLNGALDFEAWRQNSLSGADPTGGLNLLVGMPRNSGAHPELYTKLNTTQYAPSTNYVVPFDPPMYITLSDSDPVIPKFSQIQAVNYMSTHGNITLQDNGPSGHVGALGANVGRLLQFLEY